MKKMVNPHVTVTQGKLEGVASVTPSGKKYYSFKGIPYAEPPIGPLRFKDSQPAKEWQGVRDATKEGNVAKQMEIFSREITGDEDCLFVNVHTPSLPEDQLRSLPVMVYIHSGAFVCGSGNQEEMGPEYIVEKDVIMVTINYRLNVFGFLCLDTPQAPGNMGLKDQCLALKWIQDNIKHFNGCPDNVTLYGISAGGASIECHMLSPLSKGLFHKAIIISGSILNPWAHTYQITKRAYKLGEHLGGAFTNKDDLYNFLMTSTADQLVEGSFEVFDFEDTKNNAELFSFIPTVCSIPGYENFLEEDYLITLKSGNFNNVPTIAGYCNKEGIFMQHFYKDVIENLKNQVFIDYLPRRFNIDRDKFNHTLKDVYKPRESDLNDNDYVVDFLSDVMFIGGMQESAEKKVKHGLINYNFCFSYDGNLNFLKTILNYPEKGACHSDILTYMGTHSSFPEENASPQDLIVKNKITEMWTNFAKTGDPTPCITDVITTKWLPGSDEKKYLLEMGNEFILKEKIETQDRKQLWLNLFNSI